MMIKRNSTHCRVLFGLALSASIFAMQPSGFSEEAPSSQETILFLGDSITAAGGYVRAIDAALKKQDPEHPYLIVSRGLPSETVSGLSEPSLPSIRPCLFSRLDKEIESAKPDWVVACYGINDAIYHPFDESRFEAYKAGIKRLIKDVHAAGSHIILLTPPPYARPGPAFPDGTDDDTQVKLLEQANQEANAEAEQNPKKFDYRAPYAYYDQVMEKYSAWLLTLNNQEDVWVIDLRKAMLPRLKETHGGDPIHPNPLGHDLMAGSFLEKWPGIKNEAVSNMETTNENKKAEPPPGGDGQKPSPLK